MPRKRRVRRTTPISLLTSDWGFGLRSVNGLYWKSSPLLTFLAQTCDIFFGYNLKVFLVLTWREKEFAAGGANGILVPANDLVVYLLIVECKI